MTTLHWITGLVGFDFSKTYYYSGPMSGYENYNLERFEADVKNLRDIGILIESPAENERPIGWENMGPVTLWQEMMSRCMVQMGRCKGIIMMKGWPQSTGAVKELEYALSRNWPVYYYNNFALLNMNKEINK